MPTRPPVRSTIAARSGRRREVLTPLAPTVPVRWLRAPRMPYYAGSAALVQTSPTRLWPTGNPDMNVEQEVLHVLDEALSLGGRSAGYTRATHLLGSLPGLDSMAVVSVITALEERIGINVDDGDIDGSTFATVGTLVDFISARLQA